MGLWGDSNVQAERINWRPALLAACCLLATVGSAAAQDAGVRVTLQPGEARATVVVELDGEAPIVTCVPTADRHTVTVRIGPIRTPAIDQLLQASRPESLVSRVLVRGIDWTADGTFISVEILARQPVSSAVHRVFPRIYIDVEPWGATTSSSGQTAAERAAAAAATLSRGASGNATRSVQAAPRGSIARPGPPVPRPTAPVPSGAASPPDAASPPAPPPPAAVALLPPVEVSAPAASAPPVVALLPSARALESAAAPMRPDRLADDPPPPSPEAPSHAAFTQVPKPQEGAAALSHETTDAMLPKASPGNANVLPDPDHPSWPPPPEAAPIRFLRSLNPRAVRGRPSLFSRFISVLTGGRAERTMSQPYGVAVGPEGRVYVADTTGGLIHVYDIEKSSYSTIKVEAQSLIGVALLGRRLAVTDSTSGRVVCLDLDGDVLWTLGSDDGFGPPTGIAAAKDRFYVVDTLKNHVVMVSPTGSVLGSFGSRGAGMGQFNFPTNVGYSPDGRVLVTDTLNFRVQIFDERGKYLSTCGRLGDGAGDFDKPKGVAVDSAGHIYVVEGLNDVVQIFDDNGQLLLAFGGSGTEEGQLWLPSGIAIADDKVYVADSSNRRVQMFEYVKETP